MLFLVQGHLSPDDGGARFLRNIGSYNSHTALHTRRRHSSIMKIITIVIIIQWKFLFIYVVVKRPQSHLQLKQGQIQTNSSNLLPSNGREWMQGVESAVCSPPLRSGCYVTTPGLQHHGNEAKPFISRAYNSDSGSHAPTTFLYSEPQSSATPHSSASRVHVGLSET
jgi:hypothetical protein